jgi:hypothetical protein
MASTWIEYQREVAALFATLGCSVELDKEVIGARGKHKVDVLVRLSTAGIGVVWLVECKFWKRSIDKEKVLALQQIAQDIGADRAFLISESGFQAGAIRMARSSNVTLSSVEELRLSALPDIQSRALSLLAKQVHGLQHRQINLMILDNGNPAPWPGADLNEVLELGGTIFEVKTITLPHVQAAEFPVAMNCMAVQLKDAGQAVSAIDQCLQSVEVRLKAIEVAVERVAAEGYEAVLCLAEAVDALAAAGERAMFEREYGTPESEALRLEALAAMKSLGEVADRAKSLLSGSASQLLHALMRTLFDGIYLDLTQPVVDRLVWSTSVRKARDAVHQLCNTVNLISRNRTSLTTKT